MIILGGARRHVRSSRLVAAVLASSLTVGILLITTTLAWAAPSSVPDEGAQTDGQVYAVLAAGDTVYLAGDFAHVNGIARDHLAAVDAATGELTDWDPKANGPVMSLAASSDGNRIYAGGDFTAVDGIPRSRMVAVDAVTGAVNGRWKAGANSVVRALAASGDRVYIGGDFTKVAGQRRTHLASVDGTTGKLKKEWTPTANGVVRTIAISAGGKRIYVGGSFTSISGKSRDNLVVLNTRTGAPNKAWRPNPNGSVFDLQVSGSNVYAAEGGPGGSVAAYRTTDKGKVAWRRYSDGDVWAIAVLDGKVYIGGHFVMFADQTRRFFAAADAATGTLDPEWEPNGGGGYVSALTPDVSRSRIYAGGSFVKVSGELHRGFAQFSEPSTP
jgi:trimeric autotransporter adhesin